MMSAVRVATGKRTAGAFRPVSAPRQTVTKPASAVQNADEIQAKLKKKMQRIARSR